MEKRISKIFGGILAAVFGLAFYCFGITGVLADPTPTPNPANLEITFEQTPLFSEGDFLPGQTTVHYVDVVNNDLNKQAIGVEVINHSSCSKNCLADQLNLKITEQSDGKLLYQGNLTQFFKAGEIKLSDLAAGGSERYYFSIEFLDSGNDYQNSTTGFDFNVGAFGSETLGGEVGSGGGGGSAATSDETITTGGYTPLPVGLEITNEAASEITATQVTITWDTNELSTSRVIYSSDSEPHGLAFNLNSPPNYGYSHSTIETNLDINKTKNHTVTIGGLSSGTAYYFRCVSHGSFAVSLERSFTTLGVGQGSQGGQNNFGNSAGGTTENNASQNSGANQNTGAIASNGSANNNNANPLQNSVAPSPTSVPIGTENNSGQPVKESPALASVVSNGLSNFLNNLLADFSKLFSGENICWMLFLAVLAMVILTILSAWKKNKTGKDKAGEWTLFGFAVLFTAIFCKFCPYCWILIALISFCLAFMVYIILKEKERTNLSH